MSLINPPRPTIITYQLYWCFRCNRYWCFQCNRLVRLSPFHLICPCCFQSFLCEVNFPTPSLLALPSPQARLFDALSLMLHPPQRQGPTPYNPHVEIPVRRIRRPRRRHHSFDYARVGAFDPEPETQPRPRTWVVVPPGDSSNSFDRIPRLQDQIPRRNDPRDYFFGPGLDELIEQLTENDRQGPPPAPDRAVEAIPTVRIMESHLKENPHCPVCQEEFEVGREARELACNHIYHSNCIVPWLRLHNSCPVCRHKVTVPSDYTDSSHGGGV